MPQKKQRERPENKSGKSAWWLRDALAQTGTGQDKLLIIERYCERHLEEHKDEGPYAEEALQALKDHPAPEGTIDKAERLMRGEPMSAFTGNPPPGEGGGGGTGELKEALWEMASAISGKSKEDIKKARAGSEKAGEEKEGEAQPLAGPPSSTPPLPPKPGETARGDFAKNTTEQAESKGEKPLPGPGESRKPGDTRPPHKPVGGR